MGWDEVGENTKLWSSSLLVLLALAGSILFQQRAKEKRAVSQDGGLRSTTLSRKSIKMKKK